MAQRLANYPMYSDSQGEATNPTTATVMADTGILGTLRPGSTDAYWGGGGIYEVLVTTSATAVAEFVLQRRNVANNANVGDVHIFYVPANQTVAIPFRMEAEAGERFRVMMNANLTGDAVANVQAQRVA